MVKLTTEEQGVLLKKKPEVFRPAAGAWGKSGCTTVNLAAAKKAVVRGALESAAQSVLANAKKKNAESGSQR